MEQRAFARIASDLRARFVCNETDYSGTIADISENGMYIRAERVPCTVESVVDIFIATEHLSLRVPVKICRLSKSGESIDGMGVRVLHPVHEYVHYVKTLKSTSR